MTDYIRLVVDLSTGDQTVVPMSPDEIAAHDALDAPTPEAIQATLTAAVQAHLDAEARSHGYDGILSLASYASSTHPPFAAEGRAGLDWRDAVWGYCYQVMAAVQAGARPIPNAETLIAELPVMQWP
jgi:hypothetical protein